MTRHINVSHQLVTEEPIATVGQAVAARDQMSDHHRLWISRKRKEREGIPLNAAEIRQQAEQIEDMGAF